MYIIETRVATMKKLLPTELSMSDIQLRVPPTSRAISPGCKQQRNIISKMGIGLETK